MKQFAVLPMALALVACGGDSSSDSNDSPAGGMTVYESSASNDTPATAQSVLTNSVVNGRVDAADEYDIYVVNSSSGESFTFDLFGDNSGDIDLLRVSYDGSILDLSEGDSSRESLRYVSSGGPVYIVVAHYDGPSNAYQLSITSNGGSSTGGVANALACVESTAGGTSYFQVLYDANGATNNMAEGLCPSSGWVSRCNFNYMDVDTNSYYSADYVSRVGGHENVRNDVCYVQSNSGGTTNYSIY